MLARGSRASQVQMGSCAAGQARRSRDVCSRANKARKGSLHIGKLGARLGVQQGNQGKEGKNAETSCARSTGTNPLLHKSLA